VDDAGLVDQKDVNEKNQKKEKSNEIMSDITLVVCRKSVTPSIFAVCTKKFLQEETIRRRYVAVDMRGWNDKEREKKASIKEVE
jgi:hypothetical protein